MYTTLSIDEAVRPAELGAAASMAAALQPERHVRPFGQIEVVPAGRRIYMQDDPAHALFRVVSGAVSTSLVMANGSRRVTGFLYADDYFGSIFSDRYRCSAEAITDATVVRYNRRAWGPRDVPGSSQGQLVLEALQSERRTADEHVLLLGGVTACAKVAAFLLYLSRRAAQRGEPDNPVAIPMTRYDIADFLGTTPESVSRCLTKLNRAGAISMETPDTITLIDRHTLSDIPRGY